MRESMPCSDCLAADQCIVPMPAVTLMRLSCVIYLPKMVHYRVLMSRPDQSLRHCSMTPNIRTMRSVSQQDSAQNRSSLSSDCAGSTNRHYYG